LVKKIKELESYLRLRTNLKNLSFSIDKSKNKIFFDVELLIEKQIIEERLKEFFLEKEILVKNEKNFSIFKVKSFSDLFLFPKRKRVLKSGINNLNSQVFEGEIVKAWEFKSCNNLHFCKTNDFAYGWIDKKCLEKLSEYELVGNDKETKKVTLSKNPLDRNLEEKFLFLIEKFKNSRYLLGGKSDKEMDCSALTQKIYFELFGIKLPRKSRFQIEGLKKVNKPKNFDLVFAKNKENLEDHVGLFFRNGVYHISKKNSRPQIEKMEDFKNNYTEISYYKVL